MPWMFPKGKSIVRRGNSYAILGSIQKYFLRFEIYFIKVLYSKIISTDVSFQGENTWVSKQLWKRKWFLHDATTTLLFDQFRPIPGWFCIKKLFWLFKSADQNSGKMKKWTVSCYKESENDNKDDGRLGEFFFFFERVNVLTLLILDLQLLVTHCQ